MLIIEINCIDIESAQASFTGLAHVIWFPADSAKLRLGRVAQDSKFRRYDYLLPVSFQRAAKQLFIRVWSVHVRGIEERDAELERAANSGERLFVIASAIKIRHPHATEADCRNDRAAPSEFSLFHVLVHQDPKRQSRFSICEKLEQPRLIIFVRIRGSSSLRL